MRVKANRLTDVTLTLHNARTFLRYRAVRVSVGGFDSTLAKAGKRQADPGFVQNWDSPSGFIITNWAHFDRVTTIAVNLSKSVGGDSQIHKRRVHGNGLYRGRRAADPVGDVLFVAGVSSPRSCTMQIRASSTAAATQKRDAESGEERTDISKGEEQNLKEASTTSTMKAPEEAEPEGDKPNKTQQLKKVFKEYGAVGVSFHIAISLMSLGMVYLLISSGIDMVAVLCKLGFSEAVVQSKMAAGTSTFVLAYAIHKLFAPVRISITLVSVPLIVRYFRKTGLFKPPTPAP
ncbi:hypothetical protein LDENG_00293680 [Lucifuga dentata]|nr:hypothetical protein LDENG_00293680 [Lucifuga dentata]